MRVLLTDGFTREAIGTFFGTSKNAVVGFQHSQLPKLTGKKGGIKDTVTPERLETLLAEHSKKAEKKPSEHTEVSEVAASIAELPGAAAPEVAPAVTVVHPKPKASNVSRVLAASEASQCRHRDESGRHCGYEHLPDSDSCGRVGHDT